MTDAEFDTGVEQLRAADPAHPFLAQTGAPIAAGDEVALPIPLPSLNKIKPDGSLEKWLGRYKAPQYHISAKLDGCSALWIPATRQLYTRGDGMRGRDISAFVPHIQGLSTAADAMPLWVRGELIIRTDSPAVPEGKLARNIVAGALNRKAHEADPAQLGEIHFVAYSVERAPTDAGSWSAPQEAYCLLQKAGFEMAASAMINAAFMTPAHLSKCFNEMETGSAYQLDGIVVAPNVSRLPQWTYDVRSGAAVNPDDRVAWKNRVTATTARTTVRSVEWNVSASGILIPRVLFDPVTLAGASIGAATGLHGRWIHDNSVGPGAEIEVRRAGDVIPQIIAVHCPAPAGPAMPAAYEWDSVHIRPAAGTVTTETECIRLTRALAELGAENVGPGLVARLHAAGFDTVGKIYAATAAELADRVEGCGLKMAERIHAGIRVKQEDWTELTLMMASCAMPRGIGSRKLQLLLALNPQPATWTAAVLIAKRPTGISSATIEEVVATIPEYLAWKVANIQTANIPASAVPSASSAAAAAGAGAAPLQQMVVVLTGFRDKALESALLAAGHIIADAVTKKTTHLVHPDGPTPTTGKTLRAAEVNAAIVPLSQFRSLL